MQFKFNSVVPSHKQISIKIMILWRKVQQIIIICNIEKVKGACFTKKSQFTLIRSKSCEEAMMCLNWHALSTTVNTLT